MIVTSFLMGGLGNQMFQIAKALSEGFENNIDVVFKKQSFIPMDGNQPTKYINNIFRNIKFVDFIEKTERVSEVDWAFNQINPKYDKSIEYYGYFQSSKNFGKHNELIKKIFQPTDEFILKIKKKYPKVFDKNSTSIHIRRGDYLTISEILPVIDKSYIDKCLSILNNQGHIFILSNDKTWVKNNLDYPNMTIVEDLEDFEELWLISLCNNNILSNSSFSWWGAYINNNNNKKVFVPSIWFGPKGVQNYEDIYETDWNKINVEYKEGKLVCY